MTPAQRWLRKAYPAAFRPFFTEVEVDGVIERRPNRHPLKLGIMRDILADPKRPKDISVRSLQIAVADWVNHDLYLRALAYKKHRITLTGERLKRVSPAHAAAADAILKARQAKRRAEAFGAQWQTWEREAKTAPPAVVVRKRRFAKA